MSGSIIHIVRDGQDPLLDQVPALFEELHASMAGHGMNAGLAANGAHIWLDGVRRGLERFGRLVLAVEEGRVVGFTYGMVKLAPDYLGGAPLGQWTHLYVAPANRRGGVARSITEALHIWFVDKGVQATECEVVYGNLLSQEFVRSLGYVPELFRFRRPA